MDQEIDGIEQRDIKDKKKNDQKGIQHGVATDEIVENIIGSAVAADQEHIVVIKQLVRHKGGDAKADQNGKSDEKFEWVCFLMELVSAIIGRSVVMLEID